MKVKILVGHVLDRLRAMRGDSIHCVVTSPPYWGLRAYGTEPQVWGGCSIAADDNPAVTMPCAHQWEATPRSRAGAGRHGETSQFLTQSRSVTEAQVAAAQTNRGDWCALCGAWRGEHGLEPSLELWLEHEVEIFREVRRILRPDGTLWLNVGDAYATTPNGNAAASYKGKDDRTFRDKPHSTVSAGLASKQRLMLPARLALALQADGWWLRDEIVWCLSPSTILYVKSDRGVGPMSVRDMVRLDPAAVSLWTGQKWSRVRGWSATATPIRPIRLRLRSGETINCTSNHVWPLADGSEKPAGDLRIGDVLATAQLPNVDAETQISEDLAWLAGLYLAEGSMSDDCIQIAGNTKEVERHARTERIAREFGGTCVVRHHGGNTAALALHGNILRGAITHFVAGRVAHDKHLHPRAWNLPNALLAAFLQGYLDGDGHWDEPNARWRLGFCRNDALAADLRCLAARLGCTLTLNKSFAKMGRARTFESYRGELRWPGNATKHARSAVVVIEQGAPGVFYDIGIEDEPHLFALASGVLTHNSKPNPMPSSVRDRTTPAHEMLYLLAKQRHYYYDAVAIEEPASYDPEATKFPDNWDTGAGAHGSIHRAGREKGRRSGARAAGNRKHKQSAADADGLLSRHQHAGMLDIAQTAYGTRNKRSVWTITTEPFAEAHFATMPTELARACILAGTSERGVCAVCGAPWRRVTVGTLIPQPDAPNSRARQEGQHAPETMWTGSQRGVVERETIGWYPSCYCTLDPPLLPYPRRPKRSEHDSDESYRDAKAFWEAQCAMVDQGRREQCAAVAMIERRVTIPATVLDPFGGSGTTALVADRLGRSPIVIELNPEYAALAARRIAGDAPLLMADRIEVDP